MAASTSPGLHPQPAKHQGNFVIDYQQLAKRDGITFNNLCYSFPTPVHVGLGFDKDYVMTGNIKFTYHRSTFKNFNLAILPGRQLVYEHETNVMARFPVSPAWISKSNYSKQA